MPQEPSSESSPIPMESLSSPCLEKQNNCMNPDAVASSSTPAMPVVSNVDTSLIITLVTSEEVGHPGATTTIDRELKVRLTLPQNYDMKRLKSFNVTLQQDPSHWQQQQLQLFEHQQEAVPAPVLSSSPSFDASALLPEEVSSSSEKKRRRTVTPPTTPSSSELASTSSRKKRKPTSKKKNKPAQ